MTQAQKTAKAKFKQAIAYRTKTGVSLKEAFAHIYGKKKVVKKAVKKAAPKKKVVKKAVKKSAPKKKVVKKVAKKITGIKEDKMRQAKRPGKRVSKYGNIYTENRSNRSDKGKLLGVGKIYDSAKLSGYKFDNEIIVGRIGNIKQLENFVPQVKVRITRGKKVLTDKIKSINDVVSILRRFIGKSQIQTQEFFAVMYLNNNANVLGVYLIGMGGYTSVVAEKRLIMSAGLRLGATSMILCHNHPSGNLIPSNADKEYTKDFIKLAKIHDMVLMDHIILTKDGFTSFIQEGIL
jgi:DNA repair protein RadC